MAYMTWLKHAIVLFFLIPLVRAYLYYLFRVRAVGAVRNVVEYRQDLMLNAYAKLLEEVPAASLPLLLARSKLHIIQANVLGKMVDDRDSEHIKRWGTDK